MFLNIKHYFFLLFIIVFSFQLKAQETRENSTAYAFEKDDHYGIIKLGISVPIAFGDNFANKGLHAKLGTNFSILANLFELPVVIGFHYSVLYQRNENKQQLGNYDSSNAILVGGMAGYQFFERNKIRLLLTAGVGAVSYNNNTPDSIRFSDNGVGVWLTPEVSYHFTKNFGLFFSPTLRRDFLKTDVPAKIEDFFSGANYVNLEAGVRFVF